MFGLSFPRQPEFEIIGDFMSRKEKASKKKLSPLRKMKQKNSWKNVLLPTIFAVSWNSAQTPI